MFRDDEEWRELQLRLRELLIERRDFSALLAHAIARMQNLVAEWELVAAAMRALDEPLRLRQAAADMLARGDEHPRKVLFEHYPELAELAEVSDELVLRYSSPPDDFDEDFPEALWAS